MSAAKAGRMIVASISEDTLSLVALFQRRLATSRIIPATSPETRH
ncbi:MULTISPECIES: hypothetical protein [unclassified Rhizobium]|nr:MULTISPECIES: hypothetical protein [unclassified Rhizobium]